MYFGLDPVGQDAFPSGDNRSYQGLFQTVMDTHYHWVKHNEWNWRNRKWNQQMTYKKTPKTSYVLWNVPGYTISACPGGASEKISGKPSRMSWFF
jgi:hypothetical protein